MDDTLVFDIGGTSVKCGLFQQGRLREQWETATKAQKTGTRLIRHLIEIAKSKAGYSRIGISTAGQVDSENGVILFASENIPEYTGVRIADMFGEQLDLPVTVLNDVNAALLGEYTFGAARGMENVLGLTYGTGIGGGIIIRGRIYMGSGGSAGEFGHMPVFAYAENRCGCGLRGCYEQFASTSALLRRVEEKTGMRRTGKELFAPDGGILPFAEEAVREWTEHVALGLGGLCHAFDPEGIVLGGGIMQEKSLFRSVCQHFPKYVMPSYRHVVLKQAELGNQAGLYGAYLAANFPERALL